MIAAGRSISSATPANWNQHHDGLAAAAAAIAKAGVPVFASKGETLPVYWANIETQISAFKAGRAEPLARPPTTSTTLRVGLQSLPRHEGHRVGCRVPGLRWLRDIRSPGNSWTRSVPMPRQSRRSTQGSSFGGGGGASFATTSLPSSGLHRVPESCSIEPLARRRRRSHPARAQGR